MTREELIFEIEVTMAELKPIAQPRDVAQLHELLLDARDAESADEIDGILVQLTGVRTFCEARKQSDSFAPPHGLPRGRVKG